MDAQMTGPSRLPADYESNSLPYRDRYRQLVSNQKAERILGASAPSSFLKLGSNDLKGENQNTGVEPFVLNSPVSPLSRCPTSFLPWGKRFPAKPTPTTLLPVRSASDSAQVPTSGTLTPVEPLNFKRRHRRQSLSMARIETEMTDYKRDAALSFDEPNTYLAQVDSYLQRTIEPCITRRQSLPESILPSGDGSLKRQPRPLPPVPLSRPASPVSSVSSVNSYVSPRPLPTPPTQSPVPNISPITFTPATQQSSAPSTPRRITRLLVPVTTPEPTSPSSTSPISPISITTNPSSTLNSASPRSPRGTGPAARKRHQVHASPYKLARNPTRYSTTSLSSQVSVPPVPLPAELRRRNRDKMAKLIRMLGESPPSDMVFASEHRGHSESEVNHTIKEEASGNGLLSSFEPLGRSLSLGLDERTNIFGKSKKALSDPDAGHGVRDTSSTAPHKSSSPSAFLRLRSKRGRSGNDKAPRYVVSLFGTAESATPERLTFKLNEPAPKMRPTGSFLRGAYKMDVKRVERRIPPLPAIDSPKQSQKWLREAGSTRWEVDDYENVVKSLRKL